MSALSIQVPFPVFNDRDGQPLDNGYVWIGVPNLPPQTNPVNVYFDDALTILAPQPLRTINGYISRAGSPAQVYIDGVDFSILVQDSKGSMVYSFPEGTGISPNAAGIIYDPAGIGAVPTTVQAKLRQTPSLADYSSNAAAISAAVAGGFQLRVDQSVTILIPSQCATLQQALEQLFPADPEVVITLQIENGHAPDTGISLLNGDYAQFEITSVDAEVQVAAGFTGDLIVGINVKMPILNALFNMNNLGDRGAHIQQGSNFVVRGGKGVKNAGLHGIDLSNSNCYGIGSVWDGAGTTGIRLEQAARGTFQNATADDCGAIGVFASRSSTLNFIGGSAQNAGTSGCQIQRARISCGDANFSGAGSFGINARECAQVMAGNSFSNNCGDINVLITTGANVDFRGGTATGATNYGIFSQENGTINAFGAIVTGSGIKDLAVRWGGEINAPGCTTTNGVGNPAIEDCLNITQFNYQSKFGLIKSESGPNTSASFNATLADNTATSFALPPVTSVHAIMSIRNSIIGNGRANGLVLIRTGSGAVCQSLVMERLTNITFTTGVLTGTTGSVGDFTISAASDGKVYFENRTGTSQSFDVSFLGLQ